MLFVPEGEEILSPQNHRLTNNPMEELNIIARARSHADAIALRTEAREYSYRELIERSTALAATLLGDADDLQEARVAYLAPAGIDYIAIQWAIWRAGGVTVPLCLSATEPELEYALTDSESVYIITAPDQAAKVTSLCQRLNLRWLNVHATTTTSEKTLPSIAPTRRAMVLYTSGTTSTPKGVVTTHLNIEAQIETLVNAWEWQATDRIPLFLPLHHVHGIINVMSCALWSGAIIEPFPNLDMKTVLSRVAARAYSVFMAVPTIYVKLIQALEALPERERSRTVGGFADMRLMISGSAALPASIHEQWTTLTGQKLLERYGMTEIGMALSNPFHGERRPGAVGQPLPGVDVRLKSETGETITTEGEPGEIQVKGPAVFLEYWKRPDITKESFDDGWFRTGDMAVVERSYYRIMGRLSVDIIKSGGYKLSALEIEAALLQHDAIAECAVVGVPDETWGEAVAVAAVLVDGKTIDIESLRSWCRDRLSTYKIPKRLRVLAALPRNAMGKVTKPPVQNLFK